MRRWWWPCPLRLRARAGQPRSAQVSPTSWKVKDRWTVGVRGVVLIVWEQVAQNLSPEVWGNDFVVFCGSCEIPQIPSFPTSYLIN